MSENVDLKAIQELERRRLAHFTEDSALGLNQVAMKAIAMLYAAVVTQPALATPIPSEVTTGREDLATWLRAAGFYDREEGDWTDPSHPEAGAMSIEAAAAVAIARYFRAEVTTGEPEISESLKRGIEQAVRGEGSEIDVASLPIDTDNTAISTWSATGSTEFRTSPPGGDGEGGWRPISESPRDGTMLLLGWAGREWAHPGRWATSGGYWTAAEGGDNDEFTHDPTHWQPLPTPPTGEAG